jgi:phosphoglycolate phosphatase
MLLHMLDHLRIRDVFRLLNTGECAVERGQREKPAPDKLLFVMAELGVGPADTVMIGDTYMDVGMGKSAGCRTFAVTWGMGSEESLVSAGADAIVQSSGDLERLLLEFFNEDSRQPGRKKFSISAQSTGNPT